MANLCAPLTSTTATPGICDICWPSTTSAYSLTSDSGKVAELALMNTTADSPGLTFLKLGGTVISIGSRRWATVKAVCTSSAAPSMLRLRLNRMTIWVRPSVDTEEIELMPAIVDICRSIGAATATAMFSALAPGKVAVTWMVGKSTDGRAATESNLYANAPNTMNVA